MKKSYAIGERFMNDDAYRIQINHATRNALAILEEHLNVSREGAEALLIEYRTSQLQQG